MPNGFFSCRLRNRRREILHRRSYQPGLFLPRDLAALNQRASRRVICRFSRPSLLNAAAAVECEALWPLAAPAGQGPRGHREAAEAVELQSAGMIAQLLGRLVVDWFRPSMIMTPLCCPSCRAANGESLRSPESDSVGISSMPQ